MWADFYIHSLANGVIIVCIAFYAYLQYGWAKFGLAVDTPGRERMFILLFNGWGD